MLWVPLKALYSSFSCGLSPFPLTLYSSICSASIFLLCTLQLWPAHLLCLHSSSNCDLVHSLHSSSNCGLFIFIICTLPQTYGLPLFPLSTLNPVVVCLFSFAVLFLQLWPACPSVFLSSRCGLSSIRFRAPSPGVACLSSVRLCTPSLVVACLSFYLSFLQVWPASLPSDSVLLLQVWPASLPSDCTPSPGVACLSFL